VFCAHRVQCFSFTNKDPKWSILFYNTKLIHTYMHSIDPCNCYKALRCSVFQFYKITLERKYTLLYYIWQICKLDINGAWSGVNKKMFIETADWQWRKYYWMSLASCSILKLIIIWKILLNSKSDYRKFSCCADAENYIHYVGKAETTEPTTCNEREGFNFVYFP